MRGRQRSPIVLDSLAAAVAAVALTACGGGGDAPAPSPGPAPGPTSVTVSGKAVDGPLQGARACYDLNDNGACDASEPVSGTTDAQGRFSLEVAVDQAGKHRVIVDVPADAVDLDTGAAVGAAFTLQTPASGTEGAQAVFVSPLSTLVQAHMDATGVSAADAAALVQSQAGLGLSPLADFTADTSAAGKQAATTAQLVRRVIQQQAEAAQALVGTTDFSGAVITAADVTKASTAAVVAALPGIAAAAADPALASASGAALDTALQSAAATVVTQNALSAPEIASSIGFDRLPSEPAGTATPGASSALLALRYTDADNWSYRAFQASVADNTPDADQLTRFYDVHALSQSSGYSTAGVVQRWGFGNAQSASGTLHWTGTAWADCPLAFRSTSSVRDAAGYSSYDYCGGFEQGRSQRKVVDISGKTMASVVTDTLRKFAGGNGGIAYADWGPADLGLLGASTFPSGAALLYQTSTPTRTAVSFDPQASNIVAVYADAIAAGGDARSDPSLACAAASVTAAPVATLEALVAGNPGKPCVFAKSVSGGDASLDPNEWWSNSTASLGILANGATKPAGTGNWYSTDLRLRVAFAATGNVTTYYSCLSRTTSGSSRNCQPIGSGSYAIATLGDARVMTFTGLPASVQALGFSRVFVERGGQVYFGSQNPVGATSSSLRLNGVAADAIFDVLHLPPLMPVTRASDFAADTRSALDAVQGAWGTADDQNAIVIRFGDGGRVLVGEAQPFNAQTRDQTGAELGFIDYDPATQKFKVLLQVDSSLTSGLSNPQKDETVSLGAEAITSSDGGTFARLAQDTSGLVGLWALGSATDLSVVHIAFFANGKLLLIDNQGDTSGGTCTAERKGPPGAEFASWTYDAATGTLSVSGKLYDTNGCAGLFDIGQDAASLSWVLAADGLTATVTADGEVLTFYRIPVR